MSWTATLSEWWDNAMALVVLGIIAAGAFAIVFVIIRGNRD